MSKNPTTATRPGTAAPSQPDTPPGTPRAPNLASQQPSPVQVSRSAEPGNQGDPILTEGNTHKPRVATKQQTTALLAGYNGQPGGEQPSSFDADRARGSISTTKETRPPVHSDAAKTGAERARGAASASGHQPAPVSADAAATGEDSLGNSDPSGAMGGNQSAPQKSQPAPKPHALLSDLAAAPFAQKPPVTGKPKTANAEPTTTDKTARLKDSADGVVMVGFHTDSCMVCKTIAPVLADEVVPSLKGHGGTYHRFDLSSDATRRTAAATAKSLHMGKAWDDNNSSSGFVLVFNQSSPEKFTKLSGSVIASEYESLIVQASADQQSSAQPTGA